jgi:hypothetical protein
LHLSLASWLEQALTPAGSWSQDRCGERAGADQTRALGTSAAISDVQPSGGTAGLARRSASIRPRSFRHAVALPPRDDTRTHQQSRMLISIPRHPHAIRSCSVHLPGRIDDARSRASSGVAGMSAPLQARARSQEQLLGCKARRCFRRWGTMRNTSLDPPPGRGFANPEPSPSLELPLRRT